MGKTLFRRKSRLSTFQVSVVTFLENFEARRSDSIKKAPQNTYLDVALEVRING